MIQFNNKISDDLEEKRNSQLFKSDLYHSANYNSLLNHKALIKSVKRNVWSYELKSLLKEFIDDVHDLKQNLKFKVSGKILDSSTYVLKTKTNTIINSSMETHEDLKEVQLNDINIPENDNSTECFNDDNRLIGINFCEEIESSLNEQQKILLKEEKITKALNLDIHKLNVRLKHKLNQLNRPPKLIYKKLEIKDLADALNDVLKRKVQRREKSNTKIFNKSQLKFLPEKLKASIENKRLNFESKVKNFYNNLKKHYKGEPIQFLKLITTPTPQTLVEALLCILHMINHKKIELWKRLNDEDDGLLENYSENSGQELYVSPC